MTKQEFLIELREGLSGLPQNDLEERITFYREMIDDRMEEGLTEAEAVAAVGPVHDIILQVVEDYPFPELIKVRIRSARKLSPLMIVLLCLGSPIWLSLLIAAFAVLLSLYASLWAIIVSIWSVFAALAGSSFGGVVGGIVFACTGYAMSGVATIGAGLVCGSLSIFAFFGCRAATKGALWLTKKIILAIKRACMRKGEAQ